MNYGEAWQVIVMMVLGMVYPLTILSPWPAMRDMVNVVDKSTWAEFGRYAFVLWSIALGIVPFIFWIAINLGMRLSQKTQNSSNNSDTNSTLASTKVFSAETGKIFKQTMPALIPLGLSFWATFFVATVMVNFTYILLAISDPFGHGWDLLGTAGMPWVQIWPSGIPWIQAALILTGLVFSLKKGYQLWFNESNCKMAALRGFIPTAAVLSLLASAMLVYFTNF